MSKNDNLPTTERLAQALETCRKTVTTSGHRLRLEAMIHRARIGFYDDFKSDLATPLLYLVEHARQIGLDDIAQRVMDGEFDSTPAESQAWMQREGWQMLTANFAAGKTQTPTVAGNRATIMALCTHLVNAYEEFVNSGDVPLDFVDGFMGAHNFHKHIILDLEQRLIEGGQARDKVLWLRKAAVKTFSVALLED